MKPKRFGFTALAIAGVVGLVLGAAAFIGGSNSGSAVGVSAPAPTVTATKTVEAYQPSSEPAPADTEEPSDEAETASYTPRKSDWRVKIKETGKECFGSAGCNVDLRVEPEFVGDSSTLPSTGTIEVTYEVTGTEDTLIDTFTVEDREISWTKEQSVQTSSKGKKLKTKITDVAYTTY